MLSKNHNTLSEINGNISSFINLDPLSIKDKFFPIKDLISLMNGIKPSLPNLTFEELYNIYNKAYVLKILDLDYSFIKAIRGALILKNDLSRTNLSSIMKLVCLSKQIRGKKDAEFITAIAEQLLRFEDNYSVNELIDNMWTLAKLSYHDDSLFYNNKALLLQEIPKLNPAKLVKLTQSLSTLNLFDHDIINAISNTYNTIRKTDDIKARVNFSYYLSMILINNLNLIDDQLNRRIRTIVNTIINTIDLRSQNNIIDQVSILHMHCAKIIALQPNIMNQYTNNIKKSKDVTTSWIQTAVFKFLKNTYNPNEIEINIETFDDLTASFKDISFYDKSCGYTLYIEVDGPDHFFINKPDFKNGQTAFRDSIHELSHGRPVIITDYTSFVNGDWTEKTLYQINSAMSELRAAQQNLKSESKNPTISENIETKTDNSKASNENNNKNNRKNKKKKKNFYNEIEAYTKEYANTVIENNELNAEFYRNLLKTHKAKNDIALLVKLFKENLNDAKRVLDYITINKPDFFNDHGNLLIQKTLDNLNIINNEITNRALLEGYKLLLNYVTVSGFNQSDIKGLIFSLKYGKLNLIDKFINLIPETENKKEFLLGLFIASCSLENIETLNFLLTKHNIDLNESCDESIVSALSNLLGNSTAYTQETNDKNTEKLHSALTNYRYENKLSDLMSTSNKVTRNITALYFTVLNKHIDLVKFLFENGAVQNYIPDQDGSDRDLLMISLLNNSPDIALLIIKNSTINPNLHDSYGLSYLHNTIFKINASHQDASEKYMKIADLLIELGADPNKEIIKNYNITSQTTHNSITNFSKYMTPLWIAIFCMENTTFLKLVNNHTNFIKPVEIYYEDGNSKKSKYMSLLDAVKAYGVGTDLLKNLVYKHPKLCDNQSHVLGYMHSFLPEFQKKNKEWVQRYVFSLDEFKAITWDGTVEETLAKFQSAMNSIPWISDEKIVSFLSDNIDNLTEESNFVKSKEEALNKISKCAYKEQIEAILLHGFDPDNLNSHNISHPEEIKRIQALNVIKYPVMQTDYILNKAWYIANLLEQSTLPIIIEYTTAINDLTLFNTPYTLSPQIKTWGSINYQIDNLDLTSDSWVNRYTFTDALNYNSLHSIS